MALAGNTARTEFGKSLIECDMTGNLVTAGGGRSTMTEAVREAIETNVPEGARVTLVGHSQGGMTAADLVSDSNFVRANNIDRLMTFGSPIDSNHIDSQVNVLEIQHKDDVVPKLDLHDTRIVPLRDVVDVPDLPEGPGVPDLPEAFGIGDAADTLARALGDIPVLGVPSGYEQGGANHATVTLASPELPFDILKNHSTVEYLKTVEGDTDPGSELDRYEQSLIDAGILGDAGAKVSAVDIQVERND
jgi:pimeloyl-ACP methyl ester carboxylesterase